MQDYIGEILVYWDLNERELDGVQECIPLGLEDASAKAREFARVAYLQFKSKHPKRAEKLKAGLTPTVRAKLAKAEEEYDNAEKRKKVPGSTRDADIGELVDSSEQDGPAVPISAVVSLQALVRGSIARKSIGGAPRQTASQPPARPEAAPAPPSAFGANPSSGQKSAAKSLFRSVVGESEQFGISHKQPVVPAASTAPVISEENKPIKAKPPIIPKASLPASTVAEAATTAPPSS
jgi:hypothetical protein